MARAALIWDPALAAYDLGDAHPLNPLRLTLSVELMEAFGILTGDALVSPRPATEAELLLVHSAGYIEAVRQASDWNSDFRPIMGLGTDDNPTYPGMHEIAALTAGASIRAVDEVLSGRRTRTFSIAGGMHHAHRSRAAGFSVYNDAAAAIAVAQAAHPSIRVLYIDIDAHHGDGVHEAFLGSADVLTISLHESGLYAFPGTGFPGESGHGPGVGFSANVPLPAYATDECYALAFDEVVAPLARAFLPDLIVAQLGVDAQHDDPQTELGLTLPGYRALVRGIIELADELCDGRLAALGGGGYHVVEVVPLAWTWVMAELLGRQLSDEVPESWRAAVRARLGEEPPRSMGANDRFDSAPELAGNVLALTTERIREVQAAVFPHHGLTHRIAP
ncbi:MAG: acetoin utilization protein AcuC [Coriobacteriia bacterium]|nr:acetoin utilization protein AcuC [Coriobacteriia bacterium]